MAWSGAAWSGSVHTRLHEFVKISLMKILVDPYATVCDLYCGCGADTEKWAQAQIGQYIGIDLSASALSEARDQWEYHRRPYPADFYELDPCVENLESYLPDKYIPTDIVCCLRHLQDCFASEEQAKSLLQNVASLLKPGGYFFGITADSSTIWSKYQKAVEGAIKAGNLKVNGMLPRVRTDQYVITFEDDRFTPFGMKYQIQFSEGLPSQTQLLVHFPSLIRLATEVGLECIEIQNMLEFYEDYRIQFTGILQITCGNLLDNKVRLPHRTHDLLSLFTTFIFRKPDHYATGPMSTPSFTTEDRAHQESSDPMADPFSEFAAGHSHDTPLLDSKDQIQMKQSHLLDATSTTGAIPSNSYTLLSNPRLTYDGHFHGDPVISQKKGDDAERLVDSAVCEKPGISEDELLSHADVSPQRELSSGQNGRGKRSSHLTRTNVRFDFPESHDDNSGNISPENCLGPETNNDKKPVEVKCYSRSNGNQRRYSEGRTQTSVNTPQEFETAFQHNTSAQQGNDLPHLRSENKYSSEKRSNSNSRDKRDTLMGSHQAFRYDSRSGYDEGEHGSHNERHHTSRSYYKDGGNRIPRNMHPTREGEKIVDQKRQTIEEIGEQSDVETKNQNLPSILGPGPTELRFQQPIDNEQDLNDCRQNERSLD